MLIIEAVRVPSYFAVLVGLVFTVPSLAGLSHLAIPTALAVIGADPADNDASNSLAVWCERHADKMKSWLQDKVDKTTAEKVKADLTEALQKFHKTDHKVTLIGVNQSITDPDGPIVLRAYYGDQVVMIDLAKCETEFFDYAKVVREARKADETWSGTFGMDLTASKHNRGQVTMGFSFTRKAGKDHKESPLRDRFFFTTKIVKDTRTKSEGFPDGFPLYVYARSLDGKVMTLKGMGFDGTRARVEVRDGKITEVEYSGQDFTSTFKQDTPPQLYVDEPFLDKKKQK